MSKKELKKDFNFESLKEFDFSIDDMLTIKNFLLTALGEVDGYELNVLALVSRFVKCIDDTSITQILSQIE